MRRVGIDIGVVAPHRAVVFEDAEPIGRPFKVDRTRAGFDELVRRAKVGTSGPVEFVMEPSGLGWLPLAADLSLQGHAVFVPKPQKTSALRKFYSAFAKTDCEDGRALAMVRHVDPGGVFALRVRIGAPTRIEVKQRARWVREAAQSKQRIQGWLMLGNPHLVTAFGGDLFGTVASAFLRRYVDPFLVKELGFDGLCAFWERHALRCNTARRNEAVFAACETTCAMYEPMRRAGHLPFDYPELQALITQELEHIEFMENQVKAIEARIARLYRQVDPDRTLEREIPGVAEAIAPAIEAFVGDVERFSNCKQFAAHCGVVPRTKQTGVSEGSPRQRMTKGGPPLIRQYLFLAAEVARRNDPDLAAAYQKAIDGGKHHYSAVIIVAHKLARKIYAVLRLRAAARNAIEAGQPELPVAYRIVEPTTGAALTSAEAREHVQVHFPSKAARTRQETEAAEAARSKKGSSENAATHAQSVPPTHRVHAPLVQGNTLASQIGAKLEMLQRHRICGQAGDNPVDNSLAGVFKKIIDDCKKRVEPT